MARLELYWLSHPPRRTMTVTGASAMVTGIGRAVVPRPGREGTELYHLARYGHTVSFKMDSESSNSF